jgi:hypothetical protein
MPCIDGNPFKGALGCVLALCLVASATAQNAQPGPAQQGALTGKERLGRKWTDEQRIDNCNVPPDKRGTKPRPSACSRTPSS